MKKIDGKVTGNERSKLFSGSNLRKKQRLIKSKNKKK